MFEREPVVGTMSAQVARIIGTKIVGGDYCDLIKLRDGHAGLIVADVSGRLRPDVPPSALWRAVFPGGSITGAPKIRAMEIVRELVPVPRGV